MKGEEEEAALAHLPQIHFLNQLISITGHINGQEMFCFFPTVNLLLLDLHIFIYIVELLYPFN